MRNMKRLILASGTALIGLFVLAAALGHSAPMNRPAVGTLGGPPIGSCAFPDGAELNDLAAGSDLVVNGIVEGQAQVIHYGGIPQPFTRYVLHVRSVLRGSASSSVLTVEEVGGIVVPILQPGPVIAFLKQANRTDGLTTYFLTNGLAGVFLLRQAGLTRECPHGKAPSSFVVSAQSDAQFSDVVSRLEPSAAPHK
jgi:hypothetical protein